MGTKQAGRPDVGDVVFHEGRELKILEVKGKKATMGEGKLRVEFVLSDLNQVTADELDDVLFSEAIGWGRKSLNREVLVKVAVKEARKAIGKRSMYYLPDRLLKSAPNPVTPDAKGGKDNA